MNERTMPIGDTGASEKKQAKCPYCQRAFVSEDELTLHIVTRHTQKGKGSLAQTSSKR